MSTRKESSTILWPRSSGSAIASPLRKTIMARAYQVVQSWSVMDSPAGVSHSISPSSLSPPWRASPVKKRRRRSTGWSRRSHIMVRVNSSRSLSCSLRSQLTQEISLSWQ